MAELGTGRVKEDLLLDDELQDTEITLGTGKLLGIFFTLVVICAVFFTMGYLLGRSTSTGSRTEIVGGLTPTGSTTGKPAAGNRTPDVPPPAPSPDSQAGQPSDTAQVTSSSSTQASPASAPAQASAPAEIKANPSGTYMVQVAAVSKQDDAEILVSALRKKQYPVFIANSAGDALFHVQVGPFTDQKDAETMRNRLAGDGYNAIVKH